MTKEGGVLPRVLMGVHTPGVPAIVGGKSYCTLHGKAFMIDKDDTSFCPACRAATKEPEVYENIVIVSKTVPRSTKEGGAWDGKNSKPFIGEVFSVHFVGTAKDLAAKKAELRAEHGLK
jgi:hypothetical protein